MARGKKKETLTPEERLQAAMVPESEQPYKVPKNWCWVYLQTLCEIPITDGTHKTPKYSNKENGIPFVSAKDVTKGYIDWSNIKYITKELHEELYHRLAPQIDDVLLAKNGTTGVAALVVDNYIFDLYVTLAVLRPNKKLISPRYLYYLVNSPVAKIQFDTHLTGIGVPNLHLRDIKITSFPLPPLPEQQRIVGRIESLFAKLDEAKQKAQNVLDSFETRKAAILHKAFTGELTAQWRKEHGVGMESWENKELCQLAKEIKAGGDKPDDFTEEADETHNIPVVANGVVDEGIVGYTATARFSGETVTVAGRGTIGFSVYRTYAFFPIVRLIVIQPKDFVKAAYIKYAFDAFPESGTGSSIPQLTVPMVKEKVIPLPKLDEQTEIVRILDDLLAKEQQAKEAAEKVLDQIDLIKKAILARAFRGELGTNDPSEESAVELLKQVL